MMKVILTDLLPVGSLGECCDIEYNPIRHDFFLLASLTLEISMTILALLLLLYEKYSKKLHF